MKQDDLEGTAELVKPPQSRRGKGWSVVYRQDGAPYGLDRPVYIKRQSGYFTRTWWRAFRLTPRLVVEHRALQFCHQHHIDAPDIVSYTPGNEMTELIVADVGPAKEFEDYLAECESDQARQDAILKSADLIGRLHSHRWIHGALASDHLLVREDGRPILIDFEKAHWNPFKIKRDLERFWRRTDCLSQEEKQQFMQRYETARRQ